MNTYVTLELTENTVMTPNVNAGSFIAKSNPEHIVGTVDLDGHGFAVITGHPADLRRLAAALAEAAEKADAARSRATAVAS